MADAGWVLTEERSQWQGSGEPFGGHPQSQVDQVATKVQRRKHMSDWPEFNEAGDLPPGIHRGSLEDVLGHFGDGSGQRMIVAERLRRIHQLAAGTGRLRRFIVFGSFITDKIAPNDVDVFLVMEDLFDVSRVTGEARAVFDHTAAHNLLGASIFWVPLAACLDGEEESVLYWQIKRDKTQRGIVEVTHHDQ